MRKQIAILVALTLASTLSYAKDPATPRRAERTVAAAEIDSRRVAMIELSDSIWRYAETAVESGVGNRASFRTL